MKKKASKFRQAVVDNSRKQKAQGSQYGYLNLPTGVNLFKEEPDTKVLLDILPYTVTDENHPDKESIVEDLWYRRPYKIHRNIGVNNEAVVCPTGIGKRCPICEYRAKRMKEGAPQEETSPLRTSNRNLYVVVPLGIKEYEEKPHIWDISQYLFQNMLNDEINENEDNGVFADLEEGLTLKIRFSEQAIGKNKFAETSRIDFIEREKQYDESILKKIPNLDEVLTIMDYKQLELKFMEVDPEDEDTEKEEREDKRKGKGEEKEKEEAPSGRPMRRNPPKKEDLDEEKDDKKGDKKKKKDSDCPFGHEFGTDCEQHNECDKCDEWDKCVDAKEGK